MAIVRKLVTAHRAQLSILQVTLCSAVGNPVLHMHKHHYVTRCQMVSGSHVLAIIAVHCLACCRYSGTLEYFSMRLCAISLSAVVLRHHNPCSSSLCVAAGGRIVLYPTRKLSCQDSNRLLLYSSASCVTVGLSIWELAWPYNSPNGVLTARVGGSRHPGNRHCFAA